MLEFDRSQNRTVVAVYRCTHHKHFSADLVVLAVVTIFVVAITLAVVIIIIIVTITIKIIGKRRFSDGKVVFFSTLEKRVGSDFFFKTAWFSCMLDSEVRLRR